MKTLTGEEILGAEDRRIEPVDVPEWGGRVFVRSLFSDERDAFDLAMRDDEGKLRLANYRARLVAACACDEAGKLLFTAAQAAALGKKSSVATTRIVKVCERLNGMTQEAAEAAKKDSDGTDSDASPSASP